MTNDAGLTVEQILAWRFRLIEVYKDGDPTALVEISDLCAMALRSTREAVPGWIPMSERLPDMATERGTWMESVRVMVRVEKTHFDVYEAFARLHKFQGKYEWRIEGHMGEWHRYVTHWTPLPIATASAEGAEGKERGNA